MYSIDEINGEQFLLELCCLADKKCSLRAEDISEHKKWRNCTRAVMLETLGCNGLTVDNSPAELIESIKFDTYRRDKYILPTAPKLKMPLYVIVPDNCNGKVVIAIHGHGSYGKEGVADNLPLDLRESARCAAYALELASRGYIAVCPDIIGSGERTLGLCKDKMSSACDLLNNTLSSLGMSLQGVALFELMRLTEFALGLKENKYKNAGSCGFSGGGLFSLLMAGMCDNIDIAIVSGYFHTQKDTCLQSNKCGCNFVHNMWNIADCGELAAMAAPKPLYIECGRQDKLHGRSGLESIYRQLESAKRAYSLYDAQDSLRLTLCEGAHSWYGSCYDFLNKAMGFN